MGRVTGLPSLVNPVEGLFMLNDKDLKKKIKSTNQILVKNEKKNEKKDKKEKNKKGKKNKKLSKKELKKLKKKEKKGKKGKKGKKDKKDKNVKAKDLHKTPVLSISEQFEK